MPTPAARDGDGAGDGPAGSAWWQAALSGIGDGVIATDADRRITSLNPAAVRLTGWDRDAAMGQLVDSVAHIVRPVDRPVAGSAVTRPLGGSVGVGFENHSLLVSRDGTARSIESRAIPIHDAAGVGVGEVLVLREVPDGSRPEEDGVGLVSAADVVAALREPILVLDANLRVLTANASYYRLFRVPPAEVLGHPVAELGNGQWSRKELQSLLENVLPERHSFSDFEVDRDFPRIGRRVMLLNARRVPPRHGHPALILLAIDDITDRRLAARALQASEVRYRRLFEAARDGILILNAATGRITDANPFMAELLGYTHEEFLGRELWEIGLFGDRAGSEAAVRELQQHGYVRYDHLPLQTRRGEVVDVEFVSNLYDVEDLRVAQCNIRDMRDRRRLERQAEEQAAELLDLDRRKDEFLAMLSHELRNPLAPILNAVQLLQLQQGNENLVQQQARGIIARQVHRLKHLVDDLLEVSRITSGRVRLRMERLPVSTIVEGAVESARPLIDERRHTLSVTLPMEPVWLDADGTRFEQIVANLLINAAKYTDDGGQIWLTVHRDRDDCVFRVRDSGLGIPPELLPRIFDLFTQADRLPDRSQGGLGIGLSLVRRLTELHGGTVSVTSTPGKGSEFVVRVPAVLPEVAMPAASPDAAPEPGRKRLRVLVVDDNVDMARSMALLVTSAGHLARSAHDGPAALAVALDFQPEVVLLDIGLPGLDGYQVARQLREQPGGAGMLLVAVTGYGRESDVRNSQAEGFSHHLVKPPDFGALNRILEDAAEARA